ncbi:unnamed protein product [Peniophora sp. CBMAI 1063]|nr:unnamed protein product [Peniophora sp. CBMAI 1063]
MAPVQIKLEDPQSPYFYPKSLALAKVINVADYKVVNYNYLFEHARKQGKHRDRLPLYNPMKMSKHIDPWTGQKYTPLPPILFDLVGQPAGWGINVGDAYARGPTLGQSLIGGNDLVLQGYRHIEIEINVEWPCFLHYPPVKSKFILGEKTKTRYHMAHYASQAIVAFLNMAAKWNVDSNSRYWAPESCRGGVPGLNAYTMQLVALVNTHDKYWRCDIAFVRPAGSIPRDSSPTMLDPVQYQFF